MSGLPFFFNRIKVSLSIVVISILPKHLHFQGAAIEDGTLRIGDRLLEVNGVEVTGRSQSEVAGLLRQIPVGGAARLTVSRQEQRAGDAAGSPPDGIEETDKAPSPKLPRQLVCYICKLVYLYQ